MDNVFLILNGKYSLETVVTKQRFDNGQFKYFSDVFWQNWLIFRAALSQFLIQWTLSNSNSQGEFEFVRIMDSSD